MPGNLITAAPADGVQKMEVIMKTEFIPYQRAGTREDAGEIAPWAAVIVEVGGGWMAFESVQDASTWENQV